MSTKTIRREWRVDGVLTDVTSAKLSDPTGTFGVKRNDTSAVVVADNTAMTKVSTGVYEYTFTDPADGLAYTAYVEIVYGGATHHFEHDIPAATADDGMTVSFSGLQETLGRYLFGVRSGLTTSQQADIVDCIKDGLHSVYGAHAWSFLKPLATITTASEASTYNLPTGFDAIDGPFTYAADVANGYPPVQIVKEVEIRRRRQASDYSDRPIMAAVVTATFDPTVGSRRQVVFYPTPDGAYVLTAPMRLRPTMIDANNPYPLGGEVLAQVITEACLAAAERMIDDSEGIHGARFRELLPMAIRSDKEASSPDTLGFSDDEDSVHLLPHRAMGDITLDGVVL